MLGHQQVKQQVKPVTAEELLHMPDDGFRYELVRGELRKMAPAGGEHGFIAHDVALSLGQHVKEHKLGRVTAAETGFRLAAKPDTMRAPDVGFISRKRLEEIGRVQGYTPGPPDLAVEVISPSDRYSELQEKVMGWLEAGTRMVLVIDVLVIDPRRHTVTVYQPPAEFAVLTEDGAIEGGEVVPGWMLPLSDLFG